jgi:uncharacterized Zn finger protein
MPSGIPRRLGFFMLEQLSNVLSEAIVERLASPRSFARGTAYLDEGRVGPLRIGAGRVNATVQGSDSYAVELRISDGRLRFACSCPVGIEGEFCKHCVAVALSSKTATHRRRHSTMRASTWRAFLRDRSWSC